MRAGGGGFQLYAARVISAGTLIAVYLSTSDEMLPILISSAAPVPLIAKILLIKVAAGLFFGLALDFSPAVRRFCGRGTLTWKRFAAMMTANAKKAGESGGQRSGIR